MSMSPSRQKVFISYAHGDAVSVRLRTYLAEELAKSGHDVFSDQNIEGSDEWVDEITRHAAACDSFVVLVSAAALKSGWVRAEVKLAHERFEVEKGPRIFVIRLTDKKFDVWWSKYLELHQELPYTGRADFAILRDAIVGRIASAVAAAKIRDAATARRRRSVNVAVLALALLVATLLAYKLVLAPLGSIRKLRSASQTIGLPEKQAITLSEAKNLREPAPPP